MLLERTTRRSCCPSCDFELWRCFKRTIHCCFKLAYSQRNHISIRNMGQVAPLSTYQSSSSSSSSSPSSASSSNALLTLSHLRSIGRLLLFISKHNGVLEKA